MLSKFAGKDKPTRKKVSRNTVQYLLQRDIPSEPPENRNRVSGVQSACGTHNKRVEWHVNPLYQTKGDDSTDVDESDVASRRSNVSKRSISKSITSFDSGYKSDTAPDEWLSQWTQNIANQQVPIAEDGDDFCDAAKELLEAMRALGSRVDENSALARSLHACEVELLKISINNTPSTNRL